MQIWIDVCIGGSIYVDKGVIKCQRGSLWGSWFFHCLGVGIPFNHSEESFEDPWGSKRMEEDNSGIVDSQGFFPI